MYVSYTMALKKQSNIKETTALYTRTNFKLHSLCTVNLVSLQLCSKFGDMKQSLGEGAS